MYFFSMPLLRHIFRPWSFCFRGFVKILNFYELRISAPRQPVSGGQKYLSFFRHLCRNVSGIGDPLNRWAAAGIAFGFL